MSRPAAGLDGPTVAEVEVGAYTVPTDAPESDGTFEWTSTTIVVVHVSAAGATGLGFTYADESAASVIRRLLAPVVRGRSVMNVGDIHVRLSGACRNIGRPGIASCAISAVDIACWDLKARLLGLPLVDLLGAVRDGIAVYGSGGFTSYSLPRLQQQLGGWAAQDITAVKMKVGRDPSADAARVRAARDAIGGTTALFVDANGAYRRKEALGHGEAFAACGVTWFEEPVSSDDLAGLRLVRDRVAAPVEVAAGEYGYDAMYFARMLEAGAVDVLQADATRCGGITGFLRAASLCEAWAIPLSSHTAPTVHAHACCAAPCVRNLEYFHDHVRIERMLFDGALCPAAGTLRPDRSRPGLGVEFRRQDAEPFAV